MMTTAAKPRKSATGAARLGASDEAPLRVVRDSFTMPVADYGLIDALKRRCIGLGLAVKKSELLRAGLSVLHRLPNEGLASVVRATEPVKTGRPPGRKEKKKGERKTKKGKHKRKRGTKQ